MLQFPPSPCSHHQVEVIFSSNYLLIQYSKSLKFRIDWFTPFYAVVTVTFNYSVLPDSLYVALHHLTQQITLCEDLVLTHCLLDIYM